MSYISSTVVENSTLYSNVVQILLVTAIKLNIQVLIRPGPYEYFRFGGFRLGQVPNLDQPQDADKVSKIIKKLNFKGFITNPF